MSSLSTYDGNANPLLNGTPDKYNVIKLPKGSFSGGSFQNLKNVIIDESDVIWNAQVRYGNLNGFQILSGSFVSVVGGAARLWQGNNENGVVQNGKFGFCGVINELEDKNRVYNGNLNSFVLYNIKFQDETVEHSDMYWLGTYAGGWEPKGYCYKVEGYRIKIKNTKSNGTQWRGTIFDFHFEDCDSTYEINNGVNPILGDVGYFYLTGYGDFIRCTGTGGRGYIARLWVCWFYMLVNGEKKLIGDDVHATDCIKNKTNTYGGFDWRPTEAAGPWEYRGGNVYTENHTMFDLTDSIGYWCPINVIGNLSQDDGRVMKVFSKNHLGANLAVKPGQNPIDSQQSDVQNWNPSDASGSKYFPVVAGHIDPVTRASLVPGVGAALTASSAPNPGNGSGGTTNPGNGGGGSVPPTVTDAQTVVQIVRGTNDSDTYRYKKPSGEVISEVDVTIKYKSGKTESHVAKSTK
jgi:hypothetical protein